MLRAREKIRAYELGGQRITVDEEQGSLGARAANKLPIAAKCRHGIPAVNRMVRAMATPSQGSSVTKATAGTR